MEKKFNLTQITSAKVTFHRFLLASAMLCFAYATASGQTTLTAAVTGTTELSRETIAAVENAPHSLHFEENVGQFDEQVIFRANDAQATHYFLENEFRTVISGKEDCEGAETENYAYALNFLGANPAAEVSICEDGSTPASLGTRNYITPEGNFSDVARYQNITYTDVWDGVNVHFYEQEGHMKYDYIVAPNADPAQVRFTLEGASDLSVNRAGELEFTTPFGELKKGVPYTYQIINGKQKEVKARYVIEGDEVSFKLGRYDASEPLIIDPTALKWATFLGGSGTDTPQDIVVDEATGQIYITGYTASSDFPVTTGATYESGEDVFVTSLSADGSTILWSTLLAGDGSQDRGFAIELGATGDVFVSGYTNSSNFPTNGAVTAFDATSDGSNHFLVRLDPTGTTLKYSTLYDNATSPNTRYRKMVLEGDIAYFIANESIVGINTSVGGAAGLVNVIAFPTNTALPTLTEIEEGPDGSLWVVGYAGLDASRNFPITANAAQKTEDLTLSSSDDATFVSKFSKAGTLLYSSWVVPLWDDGGFGGTQLAPSLTLDAAGNIYVGAAYGISATAATVSRSPAIQQLNELSPLSSLENFGFELNLMAVTKIPADLSPEFEFVSILPASTQNSFSDPEISIDGKGRIHIYINASNAFGLNYVFPYTQGAISTAGRLQSGQTGSNYFVLNPDGNTVEYGTSVTDVELGNTYHGMYVAEDGTAYVQTATGAGAPTTPTYRDQENNTQVAVVQPSSAGESEGHLAVFHNVLPQENTVDDFQPGNDEFCVNSLIFQDPNDGPIRGNDPNESYTSGDGSSPTHNLPDLSFDGTIEPHPTPLVAVEYLWQVSRDNGATWEDGINGNLQVYIPVPESSAGTVQYRRLVISNCDTLISSNVAEATIAGNFNLMVDAPEIAYYCEGTPRPVDITITGAAGNISWQWYDGFSPATAAQISPASGSNVTPTAFTAMIPATQTEEGTLRLIVTDDDNGCKKEVGITILQLTAEANSSGASICPGGTSSAIIGPGAVNPDFDYSWTGPGGFTSSEANPEVSVAGTYNLQVKLTTDANFCAAGQTSTTIGSSAPFDAALGPIADTEFCQSDDPATIGLAGPAPAGYVFQWSPNINLDDATKFNPEFDPGALPFGTTPIAEVEYTFIALRLSDGCIFETMTTVRDTALGFAFAGNDKIGDGCVTGMRSDIGGRETFGGNYEWVAVETDFPGGLAALTSDPAYGLDVVGQQVGTNKFLKANFPLAAVAGGEYYIDFELKAAYVPFPTNCFTRDTMRLIIPPCGIGPSCPEPFTNMDGNGGACSGDMTTLEVNPIEGATYEWTTYSVDGVIQPANTPPQGLFFAVDDGMGGFDKGGQLAPSGPHPPRTIVDFDDPSWGWAGANQVVYEMNQTVNIAGVEYTCFARQIMFSGQLTTPVIGLIDKMLCTFPAPGTRIIGDESPYTVSGADYTQAPNAGLLWSWTEVNGGTSSIVSGGDTPFPELNPSQDIAYAVSAQDPFTGCIAFDTLAVTVTEILANAGNDISGVCGGTIIQLGSSLMNDPNFTYEWSPTVGLNSSIGTPNSMVPRPFLILPSAGGPFTYTVTVTDPATGCQATDQVTITADGGPPGAMTNQSDTGCPGDGEFAFFGSTEMGATYDISVVSGGGDLSWFTSPTTGGTSRRIALTIPPGTAAGTYVFQVTKNKGDCGSTSALYTITVDPETTANLALAATPPSCTTPLTAITSDVTGSWSPADGLFEDAAGTTPIAPFTNYMTVYVAASNEERTFRLRPSGTCPVTAEIVVPASFAEVTDAGPDQAYCPDDDPLTIGVANANSTANNWTAVGFNSVPNVAPEEPTAAEAATMLSYLSSATANPTTFSQTVRVPGVYVYQLTSTYAGGCEGTDEVTIVVPDVATDLTGPNRQICEGASVTLGITPAPPGYSFEWRNDATGELLGNTLNVTVSPTMTTNYRLTFIDLASGCGTVETVNVSVTVKPSIADASSAPLCMPMTNQDLTALVVDYGTLLNPQWFANSVPGTVVADPTMVLPTQTTNYFLVAENALGCPDTAMITLIVEDPEMQMLPLSVDVPCPSKMIDLADYEGPVSVMGATLEWYSMDNTDPANLITDLMVGPGTYYLFERTANDCFSEGAELVVNDSDCGFITIGDTTFIDIDMDGTQSIGDLPLENVTVTVYDATTGMPVALDATGMPYTATQMTGANGDYLFEDLPPGSYYVEFDISSVANPEFYDFTTPNVGDDADDSDAAPTAPEDDVAESAPTAFLMIGQSDLTLDAGVICAISVTVAEPSTICSTQPIDLTVGASITPNTLGGTWSTLNGDLSGFDNGTIFGTATTYTPTAADVARGSVTLILTTDDPSGPCPAVSEMVTFTILKVDCGTFPWNGND